MHLWLVELDNDIRDLALTTDDILKSSEFKALLSTGLAALAVTNPLAVATVSLTGLVFRLVLKKALSVNRNDLIGYWHETLNRSEHYPHGIRNREVLKKIRPEGFERDEPAFGSLLFND
jgi:hypothetical protein